MKFTALCIVAAFATVALAGQELRSVVAVPAAVAVPCVGCTPVVAAVPGVRMSVPMQSIPMQAETYTETQMIPMDIATTVQRQATIRPVEIQAAPVPRSQVYAAPGSCHGSATIFQTEPAPRAAPVVGDCYGSDRGGLLRRGGADPLGWLRRGRERRIERLERRL